MAWLIACLALLVFAYVQRDIHDMPVPFVWLLIGLTLPVGFVTSAAVGMFMSRLGIPYSPFLDLLPIWLITVSLGYLQWFVLLPFIVHRMTSNASAKSRK